MTHARIHFDGASSGNPGQAGAGAVVRIGDREHVLSKHIGRATNNEAEYQGLLLGLAFAREQGATKVTVRGDSQLIVRQLEGRYKVRAKHLQPLHRKAVGLLEAFDDVDLAWVRRERNAGADEAAREAIG